MTYNLTFPSHRRGETERHSKVVGKQAVCFPEHLLPVVLGSHVHFTSTPDLVKVALFGGASCLDPGADLALFQKFPENFFRFETMQLDRFVT